MLAISMWYLLSLKSSTNLIYRSQRDCCNLLFRCVAETLQEIARDKKYLGASIEQRGRAEIVLETRGKTCHPANPEKGINAVYHMVALIDKLRKMKVSRHSILGDGIPEVTDIISSPYPGASVVPGLCRAPFDRRLLVGETEESVLAQIQQVIAQVKKKIPEVNAHVSLASDEETC